jgi:hypothetical protein
MKGMPRLVVPLVCGGFVVIVVGLYVHGAMQQLTRINLDMDAYDQSAYMEYASGMAESHYAYVGHRNRMPVYPFLQSLFYRPGMSAEAFFMQGKIVNLVLSIVLLLGLTAIFLRQFGLSLQTLNLLLIVAFTVFIFKAGWFQAELLFYFVYFCLFLLLWQLLRNPSYSRAAAAGIVAGLAHLTKASILPGLVLFLLFMGVQWAWQNHRDRAKPLAAVIQSGGRSVLTMLLVGGFFLLTVYPYISTSKHVFGRYFYNVNSTFYLWVDSWDEAIQGTRAHGDRDGWPDMPPEQIPSISKYLREHTLQQIGARFSDGARRVWNNMRHSYGYFKYLLIYAGVLVLAAIWQWHRARLLIATNLVILLFVPVYFAVHFLLYAWYAPISDGNRLILAQFIPVLFLLASGAQTLLSPEQLTVGMREVSSLTVVNVAILTIVVVASVSF